MKRSIVDVATLAALFIAALVGYRRLTGPSPIAWLDTFRDESEIRQCLVNSSCTLVGVYTSIKGLVAAVAWLELRTVLAWLGVGLNGAHLVMQLLNALAVVLVFHVAARLGGRLAGVAAVSILMFYIGALGIQLSAVFNQQILLFLGAVFVLACTAAVDRPGVAAVTLAALVGAVMANVHVACVTTGASVVWVALLAPRRRFLLAVFGAALFAAATYVIAPPSWHQNFIGLLEHVEASSRTDGAMAFRGDQLLAWALFAIGAWLVTLVSRAPVCVEYRRRSQGALAVVVPFLAVCLVAPYFGIEAKAGYLAHLKAASAIAAALPLALVVGALPGSVIPKGLLLAVEQVLPLSLALVIGLCVGRDVMADTADVRTPAFEDLVAVAHILHDEHGWDRHRILESLKTPSGVAVLLGVWQLTADGAGRAPAAADVGSSALLMTLPADELPHPLPAGWNVARRSARAATVLIFTTSRIDWSRFEVCARPANGPEQPCTESGWRFDEAADSFAVPNMPPSGLSGRGTLTLRLPLRGAARGSTEAIFMPHMRNVCGGHITSVGDSTLRVEPDRRHATLAAVGPGQATSSSIELEWQIGSVECDGGAYEGLPPFIVEGDAATVRLVEAILSKADG
jgi:hypothetical protein